MRRKVRLSLSMIAPTILTAACASHADTMQNASGAAVAASGAVSAQSGEWQSVVSGRLENGVQFAILPRRSHEPGLGLLMRNEGGFIEERRPGERGLAHLIEHLMFLSPTIGAPNDLHHFMNVGPKVTFPAPAVATTTWRESNYFFSTTTTDLADLDTMLALLREVATDLTFRRDAVDEARLQIEREMAERKLGNDIYASYIAAVAPRSPNDEIDAQNSDDVATASVDTIRGLYHRLYQPANMIIVVVGNVDPTDAGALIERRFGDWQGVSSERTHIGGFQADRIAPVSFSARPEGRRVAMATVVMPMPLPPSSPRQQGHSILMDMLAVRVVNNRFVQAQPDSPPGKVGMFIENGEQGHRQIMLWDNFEGDEWQPAVTGLWRLRCDIRTTGFSDSEWDAAKQGVLRDLQQRADAIATAINVELAKDLSHAISAGQNLIAPDQLLSYARSFLPTVSASTGNRWFVEQWVAEAEHLRVEAPELGQVAEPTSAIRTIADQANALPVCKVRQ